jgi:hypothetical protein
MARTYVPEAALPPGSIELTVGRFTRFSELGAFSETLSALSGVRSVVTQQFLKGMVTLRVNYDSPIELADRLRELRQLKPEVQETGPARLEMVVFAETRERPSEPAAVAQPTIRVAPAAVAQAEAVAAHAWAHASLLHALPVEAVTPVKTSSHVPAKALAVANTLAVLAAGLLVHL